MITYINIDTILSDPLLLTAAVLIIVGPILFLVSLWNLIRAPKKKDPLFDPKAHHDEDPILNTGKKNETSANPIIAKNETPAPPEKVIDEPAIQQTPAPVTVQKPKPMDMERTVVMPPGMAEIQGQLEIAFSQIKHLNKKVMELENALASGGTPSANPASSESPSNTTELAQKLLKLAEHVIVLEKNVNKLMHNKPSLVPSELPPQSKPPIMPL